MQIISDTVLLQEGEIKYGIIKENNCGYSVASPKIKLQESVMGEETDTVTRVYIDCILQKANAQNRNGRIYPKHVLEREIAKFKELLPTKSFFSALDHPDSTIVSLKRDELSHIITDFWWEGDNLMGTLEIITSPAFHKQGSIHCAGDHVANLLNRGYKLGISSRGLGSLKNIGGKNIVQDDFDLIAFDIVASPSTPNAYLLPKTEQLKENFITQNIAKTDVFEKKFKNFLKK